MDTERVVTNAVLVFMWSLTIFCSMGGGGDEVAHSKFLLSMLLRSGSFRK